MAGTVSSLGTLANGSSSVLNADLVDKLKSAETSTRITPITNELSKLTTEQASLTNIITYMSSVKTAALDLSDEGSYLKRSATSSDSSVSITAGSGTQTQTATINVSQLAQNHVMQSAGFASTSSSVSSTASSLTLNLNGTNYSINVTAGMTLDQLSQAINDATNGAITASTLNTGVGSSPYKLILKAKNSGDSNTISVTEGSGMATGFANSSTASTAVQASSFTLGNNDLTINGVAILGTINGTSSAVTSQNLADLINSTSGVGVYASVDTTGKLILTNNSTSPVSVVASNAASTDTGLASGTTTISNGGTIQSPQNAKFTYNGISMERTTNSITDLIGGATVTLNNKSTTTANISITQDTSGIPTLVNTFVSAFNSAMSALSDATAYNSDTKTAGALQGVAEVSGIYSSLTSILTNVTSDGKSLMDYGFSLDKNGTLSVDSTVLNNKLSSDPSALEALFRGTSTVNKATYTALRTADVSNTTTAIGAVTINGVNLAPVTISSTNTAEQNAQMFVTAINNLYDSTGVKAYTDGNGKLILENPAGGQIQVSTTASGALASGLSSSSSSSVAMNSSIVGLGSTTTTDGIFKQMNTALAGLLTNSDATLTLLSTSIQSQMDSRNAEKTKVTDDITAKYEQLANQYAQYNSIISKFQQSFASMQSMINSSSSSSGG